MIEETIQKLQGEVETLTHDAHLDQLWRVVVRLVYAPARGAAGQRGIRPPNHVFPLDGPPGLPAETIW